MALVVAGVVGLPACGEDDWRRRRNNYRRRRDRNDRPRGLAEPILIKTDVTFLKILTAKAETTGEVLPGSTLGDAPFCVGGTFSDRSGEPPLGLVVKTIRCPGGDLTITFSPTQPSLKQSW